MPSSSSPSQRGVLIGREVDQELEFFGNLRARVTATAVAALLAAVVVVAVTALGNGAVGVDRLRAVGVPLLPFAAALAAEVLAGALLWLGYLLLRERHASRRLGTADPSETADRTRAYRRPHRGCGRAGRPRAGLCGAGRPGAGPVGESAT